MIIVECFASILQCGDIDKSLSSRRSYYTVVRCLMLSSRFVPVPFNRSAAEDEAIADCCPDSCEPFSPLWVVFWPELWTLVDSATAGSMTESKLLVQ